MSVCWSAVYDCDMSSLFHVPASVRTQCRSVGLPCLIVTCLLDFMYLLVLEHSVGGWSAVYDCDMSS